MVSSAVYRYFPSRDALLTRLIIDGYNSLADHCQSALADVDGGGPEQWQALAHAVRGWARTNPHEFALLYGTPVPGYKAPEDTIDPAVRVILLFVLGFGWPRRVPVNSRNYRGRGRQEAIVWYSGPASYLLVGFV